MPKLKTHRGAAKRFKKTATGKFVRSKAFKQHILTSKSRSRKRGLKGNVVVVRRRPGLAAPDAAELGAQSPADPAIQLSSETRGCGPTAIRDCIAG